MKKQILTTLVLFTVVFTSLQELKAQIKEGAITYTMSIDGLPPEQAAMMEGMEMKMTFKNGKSRSEMNSAFMNSVTVTDEKGEFVVLMDGMGQKNYYKGNSKEKEAKKKKKESNEPKITYTEEKKQVAGYECKKAIVETKEKEGETSSSVVWYTEKIAPIENSSRSMQFKGLKGVPLEFEMSQGPMKFKIVATKISDSPVPDTQFSVSTEGYTEVDPETMRGGQ